MQVGIDKGIEVPVHHRLPIMGLMTAPVILYQGVGVKNVGANLGAPANLELFPLNFSPLLSLLFLFQFIQL